jgi:hypothetical protein
LLVNGDSRNDRWQLLVTFLLVKLAGDRAYELRQVGAHGIVASFVSRLVVSSEHLRPHSLDAKLVLVNHVRMINDILICLLSNFLTQGLYNSLWFFVFVFVI